jgi:anti-anti-sigma regulatory factor
MKTADIDLARMLEFDPQSGQVALGSDRMLIFRQQAMSTLRGLMYEQLGAELARAILSQFGYQCGTGDYANLISNYAWDSELDQLTSGPVLHSWEGIVRATPTVVDYDRSSGRFQMEGEWHNSYEAHCHLHQLGPAREPVCHSLTGYASGYASAFFGRPVLALETSCVGKGDALCRFEIRDIERWGPEADPWKAALKSTEVALVRELEAKLELIRAQQDSLEQLNHRQRVALSQLSTPIMEIWDHVLVLPIIGIIDTERSEELMRALLDAIAHGRARCAILDITGVEVVDTSIAGHLLQVVRAAQLLGAYCVVTGVTPNVAQTLVAIGAELANVTTLRDLKQGLQACIRFMQTHARAH